VTGTEPAPLARAAHIQERTMTITGHCYCGELGYEAQGDPVFKAQCHCRECQYLTGGAENYFMLIPAAGFQYVKGAPKTFTRSDLATPVTREFCGTCGTQIVTRTPASPGFVVLKVGTMDDPKLYGGPKAAIYTCDVQPFHQIPEGMKQFEKLPG
jgi:hypothetical protein